MSDLIKMLGSTDLKNVKQVTQFYLTLKGYYNMFAERMPNLDLGTLLRRILRDEVMSTKRIPIWTGLEHTFKHNVNLELFLLVHLAIFSRLIAAFRTHNARESWLAIALCIAIFGTALVARNVVMFHAIDMFEQAGVLLSIIQYISTLLHGIVWTWFMSTARESLRDMLAEHITATSKKLQAIDDEIQTLKDKPDKPRYGTRSTAKN